MTVVPFTTNVPSGFSVPPASVLEVFIVVVSGCHDGSALRLTAISSSRSSPLGRLLVPIVPLPWRCGDVAASCEQLSSGVRRCGEDTMVTRIRKSSNLHSKEVSRSVWNEIYGSTGASLRKMKNFPPIKIRIWRCNPDGIGVVSSNLY